LSGEQRDAPGVIQNEVVILSDIIHEGGYTTLYFQDGLQYGYIRNTVTLNANVALATHGETVANEVLGSGNGAQANQRFVLKRPPLTYVPAATASGGESTLTVRVNNIEWEQVSSLYGLGANDEKYITRLDDDGNTTIIFGDGLQGARPPTGRENIVATYRSGLGLAGEVAAGSLTTLQSRPLGLRGVTNPLEASGAEDAETMDNARANAPLTVLTMERIVSLQDFEDFARSFAGVGKAKAVVLWNGENNLAHITIASASGDAVDTTSVLYINLVAAIDSVRNPVQQVRVDTFQPLFFNVKANVLVDSRYQVEEVLTGAREALLEAFAFEKRAFGQPVTAAEVISVVQAISGVTAVDLDHLYLITDAGGPNQTLPPAVLPAESARWLTGTTPATLQLAQLLLINPVGVTIEEMTT
jgi:predicted phage baseplate assembly protein